MDTTETYIKFFKKCQIAIRRKMKRDALQMLNTDYPQMPWRDKVRLINRATRTNINIVC